MRVRAVIALCTPKGTRKRNEVFDVDRLQGDAWVAAGKVVEMPKGTPTTGIPRAKRPGAPKRKPKAAPAETVLEP